ncbi:hypothetical protein LEM8419_03496 [Neolewinella maritima]|uniref:Uncharacterized protein n=1 Tax=Neolewinella maritima TaxID=1383882 RepID=A0ABN8FDW6_9BACT|nr:hypothetical protein [Neolewinella maritima]CAH1002624.1 hypothetical protein LEM8419_03496 [Neolewinella maritima]
MPTYAPAPPTSPETLAKYARVITGYLINRRPTKAEDIAQAVSLPVRDVLKALHNHLLKYDLVVFHFKSAKWSLPKTPVQ